MANTNSRAVKTLMVVLSTALVLVSVVQLIDPIIGQFGAGETPTWARLLGLCLSLGAFGTVGALAIRSRKGVGFPLIPPAILMLGAIVAQVTISTIAQGLNAGNFRRVEAETVLESGELARPSDTETLRLAFLGDSGDGTESIHQIGEYLATYNAEHGLDGVILLGDNIYNIPDDGWEERYEKTITSPFSKLFEAQIPFYALLGNHDFDNKKVLEKMLHDPRLNMNGERYYKVDMPGAGGLALFLLDAELAGVDTFQTYWLDEQLAKSEELWKIVLIHKPAKSEHGGNPFVRSLFDQVDLAEAGVQLLMSGDDHNYQRHELEPGVVQIVNGGASDRKHIERKTSYKSIASYDERESFVIGEFTAQKAHFRAINHRGEVVDEFDLVPEP